MKRGATTLSILLELLPGALLCVLFAAVGIMHVTSRVLVVELGYQLSKLQTDSETLTREHDGLKLELATLKSPSRLERVARDELKMQPPAAGNVISLPPSAPRAARR